MIVHQTSPVPATQPMAQWLSRILDPVLAAVKLKAPPPIEIRPTGRFGGWCDSLSHSPDRRVSLSSQIVFWTEATIIDVYLHEVAHRLLDGHPVKIHGVEFFCLNASLLLRAEQFFDSNPLLKLSIYDLQEAPEELKDHPEANTTAMAWALAEAPKLAESALTAEELAGEVVRRWKMHIRRLEAAEKATQMAEEQRQMREARMQNTIENLKLSLVVLPAVLILIFSGVLGWLWLFQPR
jgi:hypothetical protein